MLSVQIEILEEVQSIFLCERNKVLEIEEKIQSIMEELKEQSGGTFGTQILVLKQLRGNLSQEIEGFECLVRGMNEIRQAYRECEQKNTFLNQKSTDSPEGSKRAGENEVFFIGKGIRYYKADEINVVFERWIQPLLK